MQVDIKILEHTSNIEIPSYATAGSAGVDLRATETVTLKRFERAIISTGIAVSIPAGYNAEIRPRSGLALKYGITVLNSPGTIDSDYRGEVKVLLINLGEDDFVVEPGMRIAQMVLQKFEHIEWNIKETLEDTDRSQGGYGSTGLK